jgi:hypothetical protein
MHKSMMVVSCVICMHLFIYSAITFAFCILFVECMLSILLRSLDTENYLCTVKIYLSLQCNL